MTGREKEEKYLRRIYENNNAELVVIYGQLGIGKTYLVDKTFKGLFSFLHTSIEPNNENKKGQLKNQLNHFYSSLIVQGMDECKKPESWLEAFFLLEKHLQKIDNGSRQLVFFDELPWMDTPRSGFIQAFEGFWNTWACHRKNLMVIVCGSANSWILDNLINAHGGLYNRVTREIKLAPFTLNECEEYYRENNIKFSRYDIVQSYMIFGGIPFYMSAVDGELSLAQNIDNLFFAKNAQFKNEYDRLFASIFNAPERMKAIVNILSTRNAGLTRKEISSMLQLSDGVTITKSLDALIASDFVIKYVPFGFSKKETHYKLIDPFCLFYLQFMNDRKSTNERFWQQNITSQVLSTWRGFSFENVCFNHIKEIKKSLGYFRCNNRIICMVQTRR